MAALTFAHDALTTGWFGFERPDERQIVTRGRLNGHPVDVILDTGVGRTVISADTALSSGVAPAWTFVGRGLTRQLQGRAGGPVRLQLANLALQLPEVAILNLDAVSAANGRRVGVILGDDLFGCAAVSFDFVAHRALITVPSRMAPHARFSETTLVRDSDFGWRTPIRLGDDIDIEGVVDLGSDAPLYLSAAFAAEHRLLEGRPRSTSVSAGAEGVNIDTLFTLPSLQVGGVTLRDVPTRIPSAWTARSPALIGLPVFARFDLTLCAPRERLWLKPIGGGVVSRPFQKDRSGLAATRVGDRLNVVFVSPGSPASHAGVCEGDEVISIDGRSLDADFFASRPRLGVRPPGSRLKLGLSDGRAVELVLGDYY